MSTFDHYLSYGATDQQTVRDLAGSYDGLLVPGTVAAFQREGTGGFVLTLSATEASPNYIIDPRFPLFQQALPRPKSSHSALAELLGAPKLVNALQPRPEDFTDELVETVARHWVEFNGEYASGTQAKFDKYAKRLDEPVKPADVRGPEFVLAPYTTASGASDPWWLVSQRLFDATKRQSGDQARRRRVVAASDAQALTDLLPLVADEHLFIWVSGLHELETPAGTLAQYGKAIADAHKRSQKLCALYGGFFSVLLNTIGLGGSSHGIGYGESREWLELPQSGPPPARYYLPQVHRYVSQELAYQLWLEDRSLAECYCAECNGEPPISLEYHALMKHSVLCRAAEIQSWTPLSIGECIQRLDQELRSFSSVVTASDFPELVRRPATSAFQHLPNWIRALEDLRDYHAE